MRCDVASRMARVAATSVGVDAHSARLREHNSQIATAAARIVL